MVTSQLLFYSAPVFISSLYSISFVILFLLFYNLVPCRFSYFLFSCFSRSPSLFWPSYAKLIIFFSCLFPSLCLFGWQCAFCPSVLAVHLLCTWLLLLQLSAYDCPASDELSSNQSMSLSPSSSAQPCVRSGPAPSLSSSGAAPQVSMDG